MAKDLTIRVTGTNPDGTINVQMLLEIWRHFVGLFVLLMKLTFC